MTDEDKTARQREWRRRKRLGLVVHQVETKPELIPEIDRYNQELLEKADEGREDRDADG